MIRGRFGNTTSRPYIEGRISLPRLGKHSNISFLIDTGADTTVLSPIDAKKLGINYSKLLHPEDSVGIGGTNRCFREDALVAFAGDNRVLFVHKIRLAILEPKPAIASIPSLLGRDILNKWRITYDRPGNRIIARIVKADFVFTPRKR
jgi:hypothetical protein